MNKPIPQTKTYYDYHECKKYIEDKYNINLDDYLNADKFELQVRKSVNNQYGTSWWTKLPQDYSIADKEAYASYQRLMENRPEKLSFWHWLCDAYELHNGSDFSFPFDDIDEDSDFYPSWLLEIMHKFRIEFGEDAEYEVNW